MSYAALIPYATPGFVAFGIGAIPAGWIADKWSREGMMVIFFIGIGASSIRDGARGLSRGDRDRAVRDRPVRRDLPPRGPRDGRARAGKDGRGRSRSTASSATWGVAGAALLTGWLIDTAGWRSAFVLPGAVIHRPRRRPTRFSCGPGGWTRRPIARAAAAARPRDRPQPWDRPRPWNRARMRGRARLRRIPRPPGGSPPAPLPSGRPPPIPPSPPAPLPSGQAATDSSIATGPSSIGRAAFVRVFAIIMFTTAVGGLIFQSTTFALPKILDERLTGLAGSATAVGGYAFGVFAVAALAQLVVGYLVDHHPLRTVFAFVAGLQAAVLRVHAPAHRARRPGRGDRLHARRVRANPDQ